jgi:hypothetical protein
MDGLDLIAFAKRQAPDWAGIAADYRRGVAIDPARYVPPQAIPAFPADIVALVGRWNDLFSTDFFTVRAFIAALSRQNLGAVHGAQHFDHDDVSGLMALAARRQFLLFFHDDDDFFADGLLARLKAVDMSADTCVFPLLRVHQDLATFAPPDGDIEFTWGRRQPFLFHFHTNNYGIHSRLCTAENLKGMKDHIDGSAYALQAGFSRAVLPFIVSATVKTPCSASMLPALLSDPPQFLRQMAGFAARFSDPRLPPEYAWLERPLRQIAELFTEILSARSACAARLGG